MDTGSVPNVGRGLGFVESRSPVHAPRNTPAAAAAERDMNSRRVTRDGYMWSGPSWTAQYTGLASLRMKTLPATACVLLVALFACSDEPTPPAPAAPGAEGEPSPAAEPIGGGVEAPTGTLGCVNGWSEPTDPEQRELP